MPHPRNLMKQTGDIHPPEVEAGLDDLAPEDASLDDGGPGAQPPRADTGARPATMVLAMPGPAERTFEDDARAMVRRSPLAALAAAFALGFVLLRLFR